MGQLRVLYKMDGVQRYENIEPKLVNYNNKNYIDQISMIQHAEHYGECLRELGAREIKLEWDLEDERKSS